MCSSSEIFPIWAHKILLLCCHNTYLIYIYLWRSAHIHSMSTALPLCLWHSSVFSTIFLIFLQNIGGYLFFHVFGIIVDSEEFLHSKQLSFHIFNFFHRSIKCGWFGILKFLGHIVPFSLSLMMMTIMMMMSPSSRNRISTRLMPISASSSLQGTQWCISSHFFFVGPYLPLPRPATIFPIFYLLWFQRSPPISVTSPQLMVPLSL